MFWTFLKPRFETIAAKIAQQRQGWHNSPICGEVLCFGSSETFLPFFTVRASLVIDVFLGDRIFFGQAIELGSAFPYTLNELDVLNILDVSVNRIRASR
jgi:hypothetical protein